MKKILALAIASAFAAPAFAATSNVDIYGKLSYSVNILDNQAIANSDVQFTNNSSRIGFKGAEDLGGGLRANFMLEYGVNPDSNDPNGDGDDTSGMSRRNQWVGLSGDSWGELRFGRHDTPLKMAQGSFDVFNDTDADIENTTLGEQRVDNVIAYLSPSFSGFSGAVAILPGEATNCDENDLCYDGVVNNIASDKTGIADIYSLAGMYSNGPFFASLSGTGVWRPSTH